MSVNIKKTLTFHDASEPPSQRGSSTEETALLYNQCDGFHIAFARWDLDTGEFIGFFDWAVPAVSWRAWPADSFCAWALLTREDAKDQLHAAFARKPGVPA